MHTKARVTPSTNPPDASVAEWYVFVHKNVMAGVRRPGDFLPEHWRLFPVESRNQWRPSRKTQSCSHLQDHLKMAEGLKK
jgi:hypothetical protein